ncbi:MAG: dephospho-CoA kinase [Clostridiales bacterium]|nr:dephospho-CoA kinase [Clostridiales bacterium]
MMELRILGITGGIGSGKTTVSRILKDLNAAVVDYDVVARMITFKGGKALAELVKYFGETILDESGELDRKKLAAIVFNDPVKLHAMDSITHKYITKKVMENIESIKASGKNDLLVLDTPIPIEKGFLDLVDEVWVVTSSKETRIKRIMDRTGMTQEEAIARMNSQKKDEEYIRIANVVIENNGTVEELEKTVVKLLFQKKGDA